MCVVGTASLEYLFCDNPVDAGSNVPQGPAVVNDHQVVVRTVEGEAREGRWSGGQTRKKGRRNDHEGGYH